ncbi:hypothetical protein D3C73_1559770 [compost metagenome]
MELMVISRSISAGCCSRMASELSTSIPFPLAKTTRAESRFWEVLTVISNWEDMPSRAAASPMTTTLRWE